MVQKSLINIQKKLHKVEAFLFLFFQSKSNIKLSKYEVKQNNDHRQNDWTYKD